MTDRRRLDDMPPAQQAGIICGQTQFAEFVMARDHARPPDTASFVRKWCGVESRRDLDSDPAARQRFAVLRAEFDAWRGRLAHPKRSNR